MTAIVFVGPTLFKYNFGAHKDILWMPPASRGDVFRALRSSPAAIGIIDGYFENVPAISHKEILWALKQNIIVFGASSMGALRAAELRDYGMIGVGQVYEWYRDGTVTDDSEVALTHAPAELGYMPLSEAMVNVRATLATALSDKIIAASTFDALFNLAQSTFYKKRNWPDLLCLASHCHVDQSELAQFGGWLRWRRVDLKRLDAILLLDDMQRALADRRKDVRQNFEFHHTTDWEMIVNEVANE